MKKKSAEPNSYSELTVAKLRTYEGFENFTDEDAEIAIVNIKRLAKVLFNMYCNDNLKTPDE